MSVWGSKDGLGAAVTLLDRYCRFVMSRGNGNRALGRAGAAFPGSRIIVVALSPLVRCPLGVHAIEVKCNEERNQREMEPLEERAAE